MEQLITQLTAQLMTPAVQLDLNIGLSQPSSHIPSLVILVKGSRFTKMERVIQHVFSMEDQCYLS